MQATLDFLDGHYVVTTSDGVRYWYEIRATALAAQQALSSARRVDYIGEWLKPPF